MELNENDGNYFNLTPLSWEEVENELEDSKKQSTSSSISSPMLSQLRRPVMSTSTMSSITSSGSVSYRANAGATPKKNLKLKNSIETLRNKLNHESQIAFNKNTSINVLNLDTEDSSGYPERSVNTQEHSTPYLIEESNKPMSLPADKITQYSSITESTDNRTSPIPISQFDLKPNSNLNFITVDDIYNSPSDIDMFEDFEPYTQKSPVSTSSEKVTQISDVFHPSKLLANYSCQYYEEKFKFAPQFSFDQTYYLQEELFETSRNEIKDKIDQTLTLWED